jgi:hypothetical protein
MSSIAAGTTSGTALVSTGDTTGTLVLQTNGTTTAVTIATNQVVTLAQPLPVASGGTGTTSLSGITTGTSTNLAGGSNGTIPYQSAAGTTQMLAVGTPGQLLKTNGAGAPSWTTVSAGFTLGTPVATTSGTSIDFTGIPAGTKQILVNFNQVSTDNTTDMLIQLGDSGGIETTDYTGAGLYLENAGTARVVAGTAGFRICHSGNNQKHSGTLTLSLENSTSFKWAASGTLGDPNFTAINVTAGAKSLSAELTQIRLTTISGGENFDFGEVNIAYI